MPPRPQTFETAKSHHAQLINMSPMTPSALLESLANVQKAGERAAGRDDIGTVRFANEMTRLYSGAIALNTAGLVQPPLNETQLHGINQEIERLEVFTQGNVDDGPTDIADLPTSEKK